MVRLKQLALTGVFLVELAAILVGSALIAGAIVDAAGFDRAAPDKALFGPAQPDWKSAALGLAIIMIVRWVIALGTAEFLSRQRGYSIARPVDQAHAWPLGRGVLLGLATGPMLVLPSAVTRYYHFSVAPLGETPPLWPIIYAAEWNADFWLFMAVASFALVPVVEELFFRGYALGQLSRRHSERTAMFASAIIFAAAHGQYLRWDLFSGFNSFMVFVGGLTLAWLVMKTRSLIPALVTHAYINVPHPISWVYVDVAAAIFGSVVLSQLLRTKDPRSVRSTPL